MAVAGPYSYLSAPSSPHPFADSGDYYFYTSAPSSPSRIAAIYTDLYTAAEDEAGESDFAFSFQGQSEGDPAAHALAAADDLFEGGMIRPLMPSSTESVEEGRISMKEALRMERGRSISSSLSSSFKGRRAARSLSPMRGGEGNLHKSPSVTSATSVLAKGEGAGSRKWKLKDLFLFRSASEGRATGAASKDPLRKHTFAAPAPSVEEESANGSRRRGRAAAAEKLSAHEIYYSVNRAAAAERKKKTPLPYQGNSLFGYFRFSPASHGIKKGFGGGFF